MSVLDQILWLLDFVRSQCMPATTGEDPGFFDYAIVTTAAGLVVVATVWFILALRGRDSAGDTALKNRVLED